MEHFAHSLHLHPMMVHFPIALFLGALGFEIVSLILPAKGGAAAGRTKDSLHRTAFYLYMVAALLSPVVVQTGLWEEDWHHLHHPVVEAHERFALITMWTALASLPIFWLIQKKNSKIFRKVFIIFALLVAVTVSTAAYYGGHMVYDYGIGPEEQ